MFLRWNRITAVLIGLSMAVAFASAADKKDEKPERPVELGRVDWLRDFDTAAAQARKTGKPLMILFDEVPGCGGCKQFGALVLSHPLVVDAAEQCFVPLAVRNNSKGDADAKLVKRFGMPRWAYPEVRFLDPNNTTPKGDLVPRERKGWRNPVLPGRMIAALKKAGRDVPPYLKTITAPDDLKTACFSMFCYWTGERKLSGLDGVHAMRIGWQDKKEVVEVRYDPNVVSFDTLAKTAKNSCGRGVGVFVCEEGQAETAKKLGMPARKPKGKLSVARTFQKHTLMRVRPDVWFLPLSERQTILLTAQLAEKGRDADLDSLLSPTQKELRKRLAKVIEPMGRNVHKALLEALGRPGRELTQTAAWQTKLEKYLREKEGEGK